MDIVKRLKAKPPKGFVTSPLMIEAADEIERLRENKEDILEMLKKARIWHEKLSALVGTCVVEIERLQQRDGFIATLDKQIVERDNEIERLRKALEYFTCDCRGNNCKEPYHDCGRVARDALKRKK